MRRHFIGVARNDHLIRAERLRVRALGFRSRECNDMRTHRMREFDPHVPETTDTDDAHLLSRPRVPVTQRRVGGDARTQQRRHGRKLRRRMGNTEHVVLMHDDLLRISTERVPRCVRRCEVIRARHVVAVILETGAAVRAFPAAIDDAANPDEVARLEAGHLFADRQHATNDLVAWHAGIKRARPLRAHLVQIGMTDAAERDVDLHVMRTRRTPRDSQGLEWFVVRMSAEGSD